MYNIPSCISLFLSTRIKAHANGMVRSTDKLVAARLPGLTATAKEYFGNLARK